MLCKHHLPGFRATCLAVCVIYVLAGGSILARGVVASLEAFAVPREILISPHYGDAIWWVYSHTIVLGLVTGVVGQWGMSAGLRRWFPRLMLVAQSYYLFLDVRASDSPLGTGLYQGPLSLVPAMMGVVVLLAFAHLCVCGDGLRDPSSATGS